MPDKNLECGKCGEKFDSQRALEIHKTKSHSENNVESKTKKNNSDSMELSVWQFGALIFVLGLTTGLLLGFISGLGMTNGSLNFNVGDSMMADDSGDNTGSDVSGGSTKEVLTNIGESMNINPEELGQCIDNSDSKEINNDKSAIEDAVGSLGTPTFFIGNSNIGYTEVTGAQPYSRMKSTIDTKIEEAENSNTEIGSDEYRLNDISFEGEPAFGESSAPVNIIEYSDYGCPWCAEWHGVDAIPQRPIDQEQSFTQVQNNYVNNGQVQFIMKDYPVSQLHPNAETAHKAVNCVLENNPDKVKEYSQKVFENREKWN